MLLKDKTAIVYGGSGAVGGAVARAYAREGAYVFLAARKRAGIEAVASDIRTAGGRAEIATLDAMDSASVEAHLADVAAKVDADNINPQPRSGQQEYLENLINRFV